LSFAYLDTSAFVKMVVRERETGRLESWLRDWLDCASCALLRTEAVRAVRPSGPDAIRRARRLLRGVHLVAVDDQLLDAAADVPLDVRALDAIHLAAAQALGPDLGAVVTYDNRMARAAEELGMNVVAP
jgi:uncharacterized protein